MHLMTYLFVKTVHIVSASLWIGGLAALLALGLFWPTILGMRCLRPCCRRPDGSAGVCSYQPAS
jgi:hypothetical protein